MKRLENDPEKIREQCRARATRSYYKNLELNRARQREHQAKIRKSPEKYTLIKARKRGGGAGLTPQQIDTIRLGQNNRCAICGDPDPTDLDHCHRTGKIRWLLCRHCNRGLGAFRDSPDLLRKAASMLDLLT